MANDALYRFIFESASIRGEFVRLSDTFQEVLAQQKYPLFIKKLLGEALCAATLLSASVKFKGRLSVQFRGSGKIKFMLAQCDDQFNLRGLVKFDEDLTEEALVAELKQGTLAILIDTGDASKQYQGVVEWQGDTLAESIEGYFNHSEQLATKISLAVGEHSAAGLLIQIIPRSPDQDRELTEESEDDWQRITNNHSYQLRDMLELECEHFLRKTYPDEDVRLFPPVTVRFQCTCSRERGEEAIYVLGEKEAEAELHEKRELVVTCDFCNKDYIYDRIDVAKVFADRDKQSPSDLH